MTALNDILQAVREVIVMNERVSALASRVDALSNRVERMDANHGELRERMARIEEFFDILRPVILRRAIPSPEGE